MVFGGNRLERRNSATDHGKIPQWRIAVRASELREIEPLREKYRNEMNCQIIHDSILSYIPTTGPAIKPFEMEEEVSKAEFPQGRANLDFEN